MELNVGRNEDEAGGTEGELERKLANDLERRGAAGEQLYIYIKVLPLGETFN